MEETMLSPVKEVLGFRHDCVPYLNFKDFHDKAGEGYRTIVFSRAVGTFFVYRDNISDFHSRGILPVCCTKSCISGTMDRLELRHNF